MEMPLKNSEPLPKAVPKDKASSLKSYVFDIFGIENFNPLHELASYYFDETNKPELRFRALEKMVDKVHATPKDENEKHVADIHVSVLGRVEKPVISTEGNVVTIDDSNTDT